MSELFIRHSSKMSTQGTPLIRVPCTTQACGYEWAEQYLLILTIYAAYVIVSQRNSSNTYPPEHHEKVRVRLCWGKKYCRVARFVLHVVVCAAFALNLGLQIRLFEFIPSATELVFYVACKRSVTLCVLYYVKCVMDYHKKWTESGHAMTGTWLTKNNGIS